MTPFRSLSEKDKIDTGNFEQTGVIMISFIIDDQSMLEPAWCNDIQHNDIRRNDTWHINPRFSMMTPFRRLSEKDKIDTGNFEQTGVIMISFIIDDQSMLEPAWCHDIQHNDIRRNDTWHINPRFSMMTPFRSLSEKDKIDTKNF
jgi:hypothetical protein